MPQQQSVHDRLRADLGEFNEQLETLNSALAKNPNGQELLALKVEAETEINKIKESIAALAPPEEVPVSDEKKDTPAAEPEKWSKDKHPAFQPGYKKPGAAKSQPEEIEAPHQYYTNEVVLARWVSGDRQFYEAKITSITGQAADPIFTVYFNGYGNTETVRTSDLKPLNKDAKKRKNDSESPATNTSTQSNSSVISAAASINPDLAQQKREPSRVSDGPSRPAKIPRKVKGKGALEAGKNKWQEFASKGKMSKKKDSMFRTGNSLNARVGFTGSGHEMRKDPSRGKHVYRSEDDDEDETLA